jgi:AraC family transcriptional activator of pobA
VVALYRQARIMNHVDPLLDKNIFVLQHSYPHKKNPSCHQHATHDYSVMMLYTSGAAVIEQRSKWSVKAGEVMLIPAGEAHRMLAAEQASVWALGFCPSCFAANGGSEILAPFERVRSGGSAVVSLTEERQRFIESLLSELQLELARPTPNLIVQQSLLTLIASVLSRASAPPQSNQKSPSPAIEALRFIEKNFLEAITLQKIADAVHLSPAYITTRLRKETGKSAQEWIITHRLQEVRRRLETTDEKLDVITERVGYADPTHLIRLFRREYGVTPASWRASLRKNHR